MSQFIEPQDIYLPNLPQRRKAGKIWLTVFRGALAVSILALITLLVTILNQAAGYRAVLDTVDPASLAVNGVPLEQLSQQQLVQVFQNNVSSAVYRRYDREKPLADRSRGDIYQLILDKVIQPEVVQTWTLSQSLFERGAILKQISQDDPGARLVFASWLNPRFIGSSQSSRVLEAGIRTALLGSIWTVAIALLFAFPTGVGAAIYLQEYARDGWIHRVIQTNINNLAGVPSIIYGILGLAIFVRMLVRLTSGAIFQAAADQTANGRTILSAGLTLGLLVLPVLIINAQEAIRAVPGSLQQASYGLGATQWQTIWHHVLPEALPGILTGTILSISRAMGETAPLIVVGASTYITLDPNGPFSKFTSLPIQIYQWTARPQAEFRSLAAAAIIVLLVLLLSLNAAAILLRNRYQRNRS